MKIQKQLYREKGLEDEEEQTPLQEEMEKQNYKNALEAKRRLDSIEKTTERTQRLLKEQREKLEEIWEESVAVERNLEKGKDLADKMKRAGKVINIGGGLAAKVKKLFKRHPEEKVLVRREVESLEEKKTEMERGPKESPGEEDTDNLLIGVRDGLRSLRNKIKKQNEEINSQVPLIEEITQRGKKATSGAGKIIKDLKKM
jgi:Domain of unknown function (DUF5089)